MLKPVSVSAASALAWKLAEEGLELRPIPGTPLAALYDQVVTASGSLLERANREIDDDVWIDEGLIHKGSTEKDLAGEYPHDELMRRFRDSAAKVVSFNLDLARNTINPLVNELHKKALEYVNASLDSSTTPYQVLQVEYPGFWSAGYLKDEVSRYSETAQAKVPLNVRFPQETVENLLDAIKTGNVQFDAEVAELLGDGSKLVEVYQDLFGERAYTYQGDLYSLRDYSTYFTAVLVFLLAKHYHDHIPEGVDASLEVYRDQLTGMITQAGLFIQLVLEQRERAIRQKELLIGEYPGTSGAIAVNADVYDQWLEEGGAPEVLFGAAVTNRVRGYEDLLEQREDLIKSWGRATVILASKARADRYTAYVEGIRRALSSYLANESNLPEAVVISLQEKITDCMESVLQKDLDDVYGLIRKVVCKLLYPETNALEILTAIDRYADENPGVELGECALLANIEFVTTWVYAQLEVRKVRLS